MLRKLTKIAFVMGYSAILVACGGGNSTANDTSTTNNSQTNQTSALDKYVGSWEICEQYTSPVLSSNGLPVVVNGVTTMQIDGSYKDISTVSKADNNRLNTQNSTSIYTSNDCSGQAVATINTNGGGTTITSSGTKTATVTDTKLGMATTIVDKFDISVLAGTNTYTTPNANSVTVNLANNNITVIVGSKSYLFDYVGKAEKSKTVGTIINGKAVFGYDTGLADSKDAEGYYNSLDNVYFTKRP